MYLIKFLPVLLFCAVSTVGHAYAFNLPPDLPPPNHHGPFTRLSHSKSAGTKLKILNQYYRWKGARYHFGGHSHRGIDCSALMQVIFRGATEIQLPRTTGEQIHKGHRVAKSRLKPGDLVFFKISPESRHVGVYVGNDEFIHASKMKGVTISSLKNRYWKSHYETSRRILEMT
ncbi:NlpC/P60 family protein [Klebsiella aerogenes]|uniref:NlpC/P60 family protein n=1 Tax=Klebsiella aerogenes TaxID=548 RepID=UPI002E36DCC9|nr:NlpC/P60 family protein [Klebsiella aerogenes]MED7793077.1 NlpC/P60 family protein [Klebsiella aerogenes]